MKIIFVGDLQTSVENLDLLGQIMDQIYALEPNVLVMPGDLKEAYNPVDVRVLNFIMFEILRFTKHSCPVIVDLGNHDRISLTSETESWLPALVRAGAQVAYKEEIFNIENLKLFMLPFRNRVSETKRMADILARQSFKSVGNLVKVLVFHNGVKEAWYNAFAKATDEQLSVDDLHPKNYDYVIGGHFHKCQKVKYDNVYYVGSPFATDWGEANDRKGFLLLEV